MSLLTPDEVRERLGKIEHEQNSYFKERKSVNRATILTTLAKEHMFMLGSPGTAKSSLIRSFFARITGAEYFETLLAKDRPAEAVLGPYDIPALRDKGELHRKYQGFLPTANYALLDEVGKMSSTLGHNLLPVILERIMHQVNGGRSFMSVPLYSFFGGSNELPTDESEDAAALWDRMLVRVVVEAIRENGNWISMLHGGPPQVGTTIDFESLANVIDNEVPKMRIPGNVDDVLVTLKENLLAEEINPSDRRWKQSMKLLQASAWFEGRTEVDVADVGVLRFTLWDIPTQIDKVERATLSVSDPLADIALGLLERTEEIAKEARNAKGLSYEKKAGVGVELNGHLKTLNTEYSKAVQEAKAAGHSTTKLEEVGQRISAVKQQVLAEILGLDLLGT